MHFPFTLLSLASLGLNMLPVQSAAVPTVDLARRVEHAINNVYLSSTVKKRHTYGVDEDETALEKRHTYGVDEDETALEKRHTYGVDEDETALEKRHTYGVDEDETALEKRHTYGVDEDEVVYV
ncbi:hypothetical protein PENANT_c036G09653 [Penicillium antarcticum]|uniref:Uncharacterized protein n=1 Tax=Penicillium antarcticum TaxID=416450 RepID=A0A1V6PV99_9EURO|nr:hypothetical protein PENANT_c036G09653 [Penicillium antarcticum]